MTTLNPRIAKKNETVARRATMDVKCYDMKIQSNKLSKKQLNLLEQYFKQAKYFANAIISSEDIFKFDYKTKQVNVKWFDVDKIEHNETRDIILPSQIKQSIHSGIITDIKNLSKAKKKNNKIGKLRFKKEVTSIPLVQYDVTYKMKPKNKINIAGIGLVSVRGKDQLTSDIKEYGPAKLIRKPDGYLVQITCFKDRKVIPSTPLEVGDVVGLDFGIKDNIVTSHGEKFDFKVSISKSIKRSQRRLSKKKKNSKNYFKEQKKLRKQYQKLKNKKIDKTNKFIHHLKANYRKIFIQDENIKSWYKGLFGLQVQESCLGEIKSKLKKLSITTVIDRFEPTTKLCPCCGKLNVLSLNDRTYKCDCGFIEDRDTKSAQTIVLLGLSEKYIPTERRDFKPVEIWTSSMKEQYNILFNHSKPKSVNQEALISVKTN